MEFIDPLHFYGPFKFTGDEQALAKCPYAFSAGIYLWTVTDGASRFIHYVGETTKFLKRHKEHLTSILGLHYGLFRPDAVSARDPQPIYGGMWRDKSDDPLTNAVVNWERHNHGVIAYLESLEIFFAPTSCDTDTRRHLEGSIARNLRDRHPDEAFYYPKDNRTIPRRAKGITVSIKSDRQIRGLDAVLEV